MAYHYSSAGADYTHYALRYSLIAAQHLLHQGNAAHGVCYIALALRIASSKAELGKVLNAICAAEAVLHMDDQVHRSTSDHLFSLRTKVIRCIAEADKKNRNKQKEKKWYKSTLFSCLICPLE